MAWPFLLGARLRRQARGPSALRPSVPPLRALGLDCSARPSKWGSPCRLWTDPPPPPQNSPQNTAPVGRRGSKRKKDVVWRGLDTNVPM